MVPIHTATSADKKIYMCAEDLIEWLKEQHKFSQDNKREDWAIILDSIIEEMTFMIYGAELELGLD